MKELKERLADIEDALSSAIQMRDMDMDDSIFLILSKMWDLLMEAEEKCGMVDKDFA